MSLLALCRLLFLCFAGLTCSSAYIGLYTADTHNEAAWMGRIVMPLLGLWWIWGLRRGRFPLWAEPIEPLLIFITGVGFLEVGRAVSIFNAALLFRGLFGPTWIGMGRLALYLVAFVSLPQFAEAGGVDDFVGMAIALCLVTALSRVLYAALHRHERSQKREREVHAASKALAGARVFGDVPHAILGPLTAISSDSDYTGAVLVATATENGRLQVAGISSVWSPELLRQPLPLTEEARARFSDLRNGEETRLVPVPEWNELLLKHIESDWRGRQPRETLFAPFINQGEISGGIVVVEPASRVREISEAIASLAATSAIAVAGIRSRERFVSLVRNSNDLITIIDAAGLVQYQSSATSRLFGHGEAALLQRDLRVSIDPEHHWVFDQLLESALASAGTPISAEWRWRHQEGYWVYTESIATNLLEEPSVRGIVLNTRDVTERKRLEDELRHQASHDILTGLPNRGLFQERLASALARIERNGGVAAVMYMDLDNFKGVNDTFGHDAGDHLLTAFGTALRQSIRAYDTACRLGGDEFAVLLEDIGSEELALTVARRILATIKEPVDAGGQALSMATSIGIALSDPDDSADSLLQKADTAMYLAKARGKDQFQLWSPDIS